MTACGNDAHVLLSAGGGVDDQNGSGANARLEEENAKLGKMIGDLVPIRQRWKDGEARGA